MKYKWRGILFKIASGSLGPYGGSDEAAAKAMGHELKGANAYNRCNVPNLNVSLQALIDYKGFRIHAQAILEIDSDNTLKVGSADAGKTVHCRSSELQSKLKTAARNLNICKHFVKGVRLYSACDIEGHLGHDGRFYLIDLARTFPPEHPDHVEHLKMYDVGSAVLVSRGALGDDSTGLPKCENWIEGIIVNAQETQLQHGTQNNRFESFEVNTKYGIVHIRDLSSIAHCKKCIYWNFLRPEYIKHRGKAMIEAAAESKEHTFKKYTQAAECGDLELMPAENPLLQKCVSSSSTVKSSAANSRECGSEDHIYNTFFNSSESVSGQYRQNRHTLDATTSDDPRAAPSRSGPSVRSDEPEPLSSDALSEFSRDDPNRILHNLNVEIATRILIEQLIPAIVCSIC